MSLAETLLKAINQSIDNNKLTLPTLPEVALRVQEIVADPEATIKQLSDVIGTDAALSARLIRIANSPIMRGVAKVDSLTNALNRLGIHFIQNITTGLAMEQIFQATNDMIDQRMREVWEHSKEVASISRVLTKHFTTLSADKATLAGLTHEIGILPILTFAETHAKLFENKQVLNKVINEVHPQLGQRILQIWDFPEDLIKVPSGYLDFNRDPNAPIDYIDVITVANLQANQEGNIPGDQQDWNTISAFKKLGLEADIEFQADPTLSEELDHTKQFFS